MICAKNGRSRRDRPTLNSLIYVASSEKSLRFSKNHLFDFDIVVGLLEFRYHFIGLGFSADKLDEDHPVRIANFISGIVQAESCADATTVFGENLLDVARALCEIGNMNAKDQMRFGHGWLL